MSGSDPAFRGVWLAIIAIVGLLGAGVAVAIYWRTGEGVAAMFAAGGATFVAVMGLGFGCRQFLNG
ncbi:hypothetical protein ABTX85_06320 [Streptomyces sp. NPDC096097]|uniref:hypothetical protein n=1 Tax=Streptomyces sp. NPDC096097 TaxID=3155546 RepID=UPI0033208DA1